MKYSCTIRVLAGGKLVSSDRVLYDRGRFRQESLDPRTGRITGLRVYSRDGQGISFYYWNLSKRQAGVYIDGVHFRLAKTNPALYRKLVGLPFSAVADVHEPGPAPSLLQFSEVASSGTLKRTGTRRIDGKLCDVYIGQQSTVKVWKGYVIEYAQHSGGQKIETIVRNLNLSPQVVNGDFQLKPGSTVKVPKDLRIRLPANVKRIEYPGNGIRAAGSLPGGAPPR